MGFISKVLRRPGNGRPWCCGRAGAAGATGDASTHDPVAASGGWTGVWRDDFSGPAGSRVSSARWRYDTGTQYPGGPPGWGNDELETYTASTQNVYLDGRGDLAIRPIRSGRGRWTSGRIETQRTDFQPSAGTSLAFSARIRLPAGGPGYWPAFWMLGGRFAPTSTTGRRPANSTRWRTSTTSRRCAARCTAARSGTADHATNHRPDGHVRPRSAAGAAGFHTYTVVWNTNPKRIRWYVDDKPYLTITAGMIGSSTWRSTFGHGFFILLNVAIGGRWPGDPGTEPTPVTDAHRHRHRREELQRKRRSPTELRPRNLAGTRQGTDPNLRIKRREKQTRSAHS